MLRKRASLLSLILLLATSPLLAAVGTVSCEIPGQGRWNGTGVLVEFENRPVVITSGHQWKYGNKTGTWSGKPIKLIYWDKEYDFAICSIQVDKNLQCAYVHNQQRQTLQCGELSDRKLVKGEPLKILGQAGASSPKMFQGVFSTFCRPRSTDGEWEWLEIDQCAVRQGDSGAPVYDREGKVVGIVFGSSCPTGTCQTVRKYTNAVAACRILRALFQFRRAIYDQSWFLNQAGDRIQVETQPEQAPVVQEREMVPVEQPAQEVEPKSYPWYYILIGPALFMLFCIVTSLTLLVMNVIQTTKTLRGGAK